MKYGFSLVLPKDEAILSPFTGERFVRRDGKIQIFTTEDRRWR